jgi:hypothetical protein
VGTAANRDSWTQSQEWKGTQAPRQTQPGTAAEGRGATRLASNRTGENPPYGMIRGGGGNEVDGLMTFCHDARKGRYIGSHWPNHVRASALLDQLQAGAPKTNFLSVGSQRAAVVDPGRCEPSSRRRRLFAGRIGCAASETWQVKSLKSVLFHFLAILLSVVLLEIGFLVVLHVNGFYFRLASRICG